MKICIICSLSKEEECRKTTEVLNLLGFDVVSPFGVKEERCLHLIQKKYLELIDSCDMVLVIPKHLIYIDGRSEIRKVTEDYSMMDFVVGESVSYEIAYARRIGKPVIFGMLPFVEEKEDKENDSRLNEVSC